MRLPEGLLARALVTSSLGAVGLALVACVGGPGPLPDQTGTGSAEKPASTVEPGSNTGESSRDDSDEADDDKGGEGRCTPGAFAACRCADGAEGTRRCDEDQNLGACVCSAADGG